MEGEEASGDNYHVGKCGLKISHQHLFDGVLSESSLRYPMGSCVW